MATCLVGGPTTYHCGSPTLSAQMRDLANGEVNDAVLPALWIERLPQSAQLILAAQKDVDLDRVSKLADAIVETAQPSAHISAAHIKLPERVSVYSFRI